MLVAALVASTDSRTRILTSLGGIAEVAFCARCDQIVPLLRHRWADALLVEPWDATGTPTAPTVRAVRAAFPSMSIAVDCALDRRSVHELVELTRSGADELVLRGIDDDRLAFRHLLLAATIGRAAAQGLQLLAPLVPPAVRPFVAYCLMHAASPVRVRTAADALGVDRKTLVNRLTALGMPGPAALISWCRLMIAARLLEDPGRSVEQVAHVLSFGSAAALRSMLRRYTRLRPADVRRDGMRTILDHLVRAMPPTRELVGQTADERDASPSTTSSGTAPSWLAATLKWRRRPRARREG